MSQVNFFDKAYITEEPRDDAEFRIFDPGNGKLAQTTIGSQFQAIVKNPYKYVLQFVAIDHNMDIRNNDGNLESTCDGMLFQEKEYLAFIELKDVASSWVTEAIGQLSNTIKLFKENHYFADYKRRYAYASNCQHPVFHYSLKETMQHFKKDTHFNLRITNTIDVNY
ncbi:MAG: hypothetical protein IKM99_10170 [Bacteroidales bacterium]|nr:hypothetical protein [Bacteroidales bacterium]